MKLILAMLILLPLPALAWDGILRSTDETIEIDSDQTIQEGEIIEYYNQDSGENQEVEINSINKTRDGTEITVVNNDSGETEVLEME